jgi:type 1 fimbria pilin
MKLNKLLVALSLTFISGSVLAAGGDTATLKVTGKLVPGACAVNLDNAGIVDYGTMLMTNLSATEDNQLPENVLIWVLNAIPNDLLRIPFMMNVEILFIMV